MAREGRTGMWLEANNMAEQSGEADMGSWVQGGVLGGTGEANQGYRGLSGPWKWLFNAGIDFFH